MKLGLSSKIILIVEFAVFVVAVSCGAAALFVQKNTLEEGTARQLQSVSVLKEYNIKRFINLAIEELKFYSDRDDTRDIFTGFLEHDTAARYQDVHATLEDMLDENTFFLSVFLMDEEGVILASSDAAEEGKIRSGESFFLNAKKEAAVQDFRYDPTTEKPELILTSPITSASGSLLGVLATKIKLEEVSSILSEKSGLGETGETFLLNSFNLVVTDLLKEPKTALKKTIYLPQTIECLKGNSVSGLRTDYHGDEVLGYWRWFPEIRSCLVTKIDTREAFAPMRQVTVLLLGVIGIIGLSIGIAGYAFGQRIVRPLYRLRDLAIRIRKGDFTVKADTGSGDEISDIALAFNDMAEHLSKYTGDLEAEVRERTEEIQRQVAESEKLNKFMIGREVRMGELKKEIDALKKSAGDTPA